MPAARSSYRRGSQQRLIEIIVSRGKLPIAECRVKAANDRREPGDGKIAGGVIREALAFWPQQASPPFVSDGGSCGREIACLSLKSPCVLPSTQEPQHDSEISGWDHFGNAGECPRFGWRDGC